MKLTNKEKDMVLLAMKLLDKMPLDNGHSCDAPGEAVVKTTGNDKLYFYDLPLVRRYGEFYGANPGSFWPIDYGRVGRNERLTMLALFLAAEGEL